MKTTAWLVVKSTFWLKAKLAILWSTQVWTEPTHSCLCVRGSAQLFLFICLPSLWYLCLGIFQSETFVPFYKHFILLYPVKVLIVELTDWYQIYRGQNVIEQRCQAFYDKRPQIKLDWEMWNESKCCMISNYTIFKFTFLEKKKWFSTFQWTNKTKNVETKRYIRINYNIIFFLVFPIPPPPTLVI